VAEKCLVTGVAGFIGSHLAEHLLAQGYEVIGLDCFTDYYPRSRKERNLLGLRSSAGFRFVEADLCVADLRTLLAEVSSVLHLAAQPGVRSSWGRSFASYVDNNILATQRLLEAVKHSGVARFVYASSSSVYGDTPDLPMREESRLRPVSPYGVTKLAGEHLCQLYHVNFGLPTVAVRYFTVYGPRQRPDMAIYRFAKAIRDTSPIPVYGDGEQTRDFTYVSDAVEGTLLAMRSDATGLVFNIGGGSRVTINETIRLLERVMGREALLAHQPAQPGDVRHTLSDTSRARQVLGYAPQVDLEQGLEAEAAWLSEQAQAARG
jgi:nucleoside-diphosphate-sugar epimerase